MSDIDVLIEFGIAANALGCMTVAHGDPGGNLEFRIRWGKLLVLRMHDGGGFDVIAEVGTGGMEPTAHDWQALVAQLVGRV